MPDLRAVLGFRDWVLSNLHYCLQSWAREDVPVIVVDLGSRPETLRRVRDITEEAGQRFLHHPRPGWSRSVALNAGAARADGPTHYVFTDADMVVYPGWRREVESQIRSDACYITRTRDLPPLSIVTAETVHDPVWLADESKAHPSVGQGGAMVIPSDWFDRVGGFDEAYEVWGCEETDLLLRARWDARVIRWFERTFVVHQWHDRTWPTPEQLRRVAQNRAYFADRCAEGGPIIRNRPESTRPIPDGDDAWLKARAQTGVLAALAFAGTIDDQETLSLRLGGH